MRKIYATLLLIVSLLLVFTQPVLSGVRKEVFYRRIKDIYFHIDKTLGAVKGYVIFLDKDGNQCSTGGLLSLSRKFTYYVTVTKIIDSHIVKKQVPRTGERHLKNIRFSPDDFQYLELHSGDIIYALPINLGPREEVEKGDIIILKWRGLKKEKEIY